MIEIKQVSKSYGQTKVIDHVSLEVEKGKITSFIGANGAGKSTLLGMICRLTDIDEGEILIDGIKLSNWDRNELAKKISILKQTNQVSLKLTIRELVSFGRFPYSKGRLTKEDEQFIDEALEFMKLKEMEHKYLEQLSGGQRQRAFIAMVIAQNTEYILLDEPLNNLDMKHSAEMMKTLRRLVDELGKTVVIVMHDINFASCYSDNMVALKNGKLQEIGSTDLIISQDVLNEIYDMPFKIEMIENRKICVYY
jgi:iron complex transport system ATP-binding protein